MYWKTDEVLAVVAAYSTSVMLANPECPYRKPDLFVRQTRRITAIRWE
jgi:hypothetical protein